MKLTTQQKIDLNQLVGRTLNIGQFSEKADFKRHVDAMRTFEEKVEYVKCVFNCFGLTLCTESRALNGNILFTVVFEEGAKVDVMYCESAQSKITFSVSTSKEYHHLSRYRGLPEIDSFKTSVSINREPAAIFNTLVGQARDFAMKHYAKEQEHIVGIQKSIEEATFEFRTLSALMNNASTEQFEKALHTLQRPMSHEIKVYSKTHKAKPTGNSFVDTISSIRYKPETFRYVVVYRPTEVNAVGLEGLNLSERYSASKGGNGESVIELQFSAGGLCIDFITAGVESASDKIINAYREEFSDILTLEDPEPVSKGAITAAAKKMKQLGISSQVSVLLDKGSVWDGNGAGEWLPAMVFITNSEIENAASTPILLEHKESPNQSIH